MIFYTSLIHMVFFSFEAKKLKIEFEELDSFFNRNENLFAFLESVSFTDNKGLRAWFINLSWCGTY